MIATSIGYASSSLPPQISLVDPRICLISSAIATYEVVSAK